MVLQKKIFILLFCCCFRIRDPGSGMGKNQDPGSATLALGHKDFGLFARNVLSGHEFGCKIEF